MENKANTGSGNIPQKFNPEEQTLDQLIEQAVAAAAKGENAEQLLEAMQVMYSASEKEKIRKAFSAALTRKNLRPPSNEVADIPSRRTLARIRAALAISAKQMMDRIALLVRSKPDVAARIKEAGKMLVKNGVVADKVAMSDVDLGTISPSTGRATTQDRGAQRGG